MSKDKDSIRKVRADLEAVVADLEQLVAFLREQEAAEPTAEEEPQ